MSRWVRMPATMITAPARVSSHPAIDRPLKKSRPMPRTSGISDSPKALLPPHRQKFEVTITCVVSRYAPATAMQRPRRNCPIPPLVPPAPAIRSFAMNAILVLAAVVLAGQASGEFKAGARAPIRPKYSAAYEVRDMRDARKHAVEVILSEAPVDVAAAIAEPVP